MSIEAWEPECPSGHGSESMVIERDPEQRIEIPTWQGAPINRVTRAESVYAWCSRAGCGQVVHFESA